MNKSLMLLTALTLAVATQTVSALTRLTYPNDPLASQGGLSRLADASWDGRYVLVESTARNLSSEPVPDGANLYLYDRSGGSVTVVSTLHAGFGSPPLRTSGQSDFQLSQNARYILGYRQSDFVGLLLRFDRARDHLTELARAEATGTASASNYFGFSTPWLSITGRQVTAEPLRLTRAPFGAPFISGNGPGPVLLASADRTLVPAMLPADAGSFQISADGHQLFYRTAVQSFRLTPASGLTLPLGRTSLPLLLSANGRRVAMVRDDAPDKVLLLELGDSAADTRLQILARGLSDPRLAGISNDGAVVVIPSTEGVTVWHNGHVALASSPYAGESAARVALGPDGRLLAWTSDAADELVITNRHGQLLARASGAANFVIDRVIVTRLGAAFEARGTAQGLEPVPMAESNVYFLPAPQADAHPSIALQLEQPAQGAVVSGVGTIRGWAFGEDPIESVSLRIDGADYGGLPHGGPRGDVAAAFPAQPDADQSGFSAAFNFNELGAGYHRMVVTAVDGTGKLQSQVVDFVVTPAATTFLPRIDQVNLTAAQPTLVDGEIVVRDVRIDGAMHTLVLGWEPATQSFQIVAVR